jgi:antitoxin VapB
VKLTRPQLIAIIGIHQEVGVRGRKSAKIFWTGRSQAVRLPKEFRFDSETVSVRREGKAVILEPANDWPEGYVESFAGVPDDLARPAQGKVERRARIR